MQLKYKQTFESVRSSNALGIFLIASDRPDTASLTETTTPYAPVPTTLTSEYLFGTQNFDLHPPEGGGGRV